MEPHRLTNQRSCDLDARIKDINSALSTYLRRIVIALSGKCGSGKDTAADIIQKYFPSFGRGAFATKLKSTINYLFGDGVTAPFNKSDIATFDDVQYTFAVLAQKLGDGLRAHIHPHIWINALLNDPNLPRLVVITDCRYKNEAIRIQRDGGIVIRIDRPRELRLASLVGRDENHSSELDLDDYAFTHRIINDEPIQCYERDVVFMLVKHLEGVLGIADGYESAVINQLS